MIKVLDLSISNPLTPNLKRLRPISYIANAISRAFYLNLVFIFLKSRLKRFTPLTRRLLGLRATRQPLGGHIFAPIFFLTISPQSEGVEERNLAHTQGRGNRGGGDTLDCEIRSFFIFVCFCTSTRTWVFIKKNSAPYPGFLVLGRVYLGPRETFAPLPPNFKVVPAPLHTYTWIW